MVTSQKNLLMNKQANNFFKKSPLIHCITNEVTCESMANALLYVNSKPIMAVDEREFKELFEQTDGLLLNLGHLSIDRQEQLLAASQEALHTNKPTVIDVVGVSASSLRKKLALTLLENKPTVVKGNTSEMRKLCDLKSSGRGVDGDSSDQEKASLQELSETLKKWTQQYPETSFLATGETDIIVTPQTSYYLKNGVPELDQMTGTGDIVGALIASLLGQGIESEMSLVGAVSYFNLCGESALTHCKKPLGMADFRHELFNELSRLYKKDDWWQQVKGEKL
ncbi:hydroxyethylthiazole kinase [Vagococcus carniphilus]|nr:hydroxyethylthiazole kinase [Vagococcus carniphilus]MDT2813926.1 hydroxyethylthiazole kinase [Vagococcus carniphilus]